MASVLFDRMWAEPGRMREALDATTVSPARLADLQGEAADLEHYSKPHVIEKKNSPRAAS
jgi:hypothetical protein